MNRRHQTKDRKPRSQIKSLLRGSVDDGHTGTSKGFKKGLLRVSYQDIIILCEEGTEICHRPVRVVR